MRQRLTIESIKEAIESEEGYKLLSTEYTNRVKLEIKCPNNHIFLMRYDGFKSGYRCKECYFNRKRHSLDYVKEQIEKIDGYKLLSNEYNTAQDLLDIKCDKNHIFKITYACFQQGSRCSTCWDIKNKQYGIEKRLSYDFVKNFIENFDGYKLVSNEYINCNSKLKIKCPEEHVYETTWSTFKSGSRCSDCNYILLQNFNNENRLEYKFVKDYIEKAGYKLLSTYYNRCRDYLTIKCPNDHIYECIWSNFKNGNRCKDCSYLHNNSYTFKEYILPSGKLVKYQGYEHYAIDILLQTYKEEEIDIHPNLIINYKLEDKDRKHYPDIYIQKDNLIIEVKSNWTYNTTYKSSDEKNIEKQKAAKEFGYRYEFWIISNDGNLIEIID